MCGNRPQTVVPGETAAFARLQAARLQIDLIVHDEDRIRLELEEARGRTDGPAGVVHERLRLEQPDAMTVEPHLGELPGELSLPRDAVPARQFLDHHPADVVAVAGIFAAGIAEADDEEVERRGALASTPR